MIADDEFLILDTNIVVHLSRGDAFGQRRMADSRLDA